MGKRLDVYEKKNLVSECFVPSPGFPLVLRKPAKLPSPYFRTDPEKVQEEGKNHGTMMGSLIKNCLSPCLTLYLGGGFPELNEALFDKRMVEC